jgi:two-component system cell cycle response regulator
MPARVLVVDDLPANVKLLEVKLTREYYDVITALDGPTALEAAETESPDIILLDVMMPGMDGFEVCRRLREVSDRVLGLEAGADDFLTKPISDLPLFARIKSLTRLKMTMDEWRRREETCDQFGVLTPGRSSDEEDTTAARVLVVERDEALCKTIARAVAREEPDEVITARCHEEAVALARDSRLDLVIVGAVPGGEDTEMLRFCSALRAQEASRNLPILILVDEDEEEHLAKGLELGVNDYVVKPVDRNELAARARTQIRRKRYQERLHANYERSLSLALTDSLTGLYNHRYATTHLATVIERVAAGTKPVGVLMIDIDFFKPVNDKYGHAVGDEVLRQVARRLADSVRGFDMVARLGGEEFTVVHLDTSPQVVARIAERVRRAIASAPFPVSDPVGEIDLTVSIGATMVRPGVDTPDTLLKRADQAMYQAKRQGRNQVVMELGLDEEVRVQSATA